MKKKTLFAGILGLFVLAMTAVPTKVFAIEAGFDAGYYAQNNPDVVAVYGTDSESLYQHYLNHGRAEGRAINGSGGEGAAPAEAAPAPAAPVVTQSSGVPSDFDASYYASKNPDVVAVYGTDARNLYKHYVDYGRGEGRFKNAAEESGGVPAAPAANLPYQTYVDVDLANQRVTYYENGVEIISSGCVSGNTSLGRGTPKGTWRILSHVAGKTLTGPTWRVWVDYWMQFTPSACGLHDATWRSSSEFGSGNYTSNGSHGCVNLPHSFAADLFNRVNVGTIVYVH